MREDVPTGPEWVHEIKYDGYRIQLHISGKRALTYTRREYDWSTDSPHSDHCCVGVPGRQRHFGWRSLIVPGWSFGLHYAKLQQDLAAGRSDRFLDCTFDLLHVDHVDLRDAPLLERKSALKDILASAPRASGCIIYSEHLQTAGEMTQRRACEMGLEGLVSKLRNSPDRSGRQESWIKVKCLKTASFPIVAFVEKLGAVPRTIASVDIGRQRQAAGLCRQGTHWLY